MELTVAALMMVVVAVVELEVIDHRMDAVEQEVKNYLYQQDHIQLQSEVVEQLVLLDAKHRVPLVVIQFFQL